MHPPLAEELRFRQIHLDFHTSEKIAGIGSRFNKKQWQEMLQLGHVDSVTIFSKCHHGLSYHDTSIGTRHPHMEGELMAQQMEACREIDVRTPLYVSAGFDEMSAYAHPEWSIKRKDGTTWNPNGAGYKRLCFNTPYLDFLCAQIEEVVDNFDGGDGFFLDIVAPTPCYCQWCMVDMEARGIDPSDDDAVLGFAQIVDEKYLSRTTASCHKKNPALRVFHNAGHIAKGAHHVMQWNSHLELESLPTGGWGYDHFPLSAKYAATTGKDFLGMTGKFHTTWGEFGGFKRDNALRYECAAMLAFGSKCSVGDQLHPSGEMNPDTYRLIGAAYSEVEAKEAWCKGAKPVSEIALVSPEAMHADRPGSHRQSLQAEEGASRMLLEAHLPFDVVDLQHDLSPYRLVILPDEVTLEGKFAEKIKEYAANGGKLLLSGKSGMNADCTEFALDIGVKVVGRSEFDPDYIVPTELAPSLPVRGPFVIHGAAWDIQATGKDVLANRAVPYFNRAWNHFSSHQHTPDAHATDYPAVVADDNVAYFAHPIFTRYRLYGQPLYRDLVVDAINRLIGDTAVTVGLPTAGRASLMQQAKHDRYILHLLYATPVLRGASGNQSWGRDWSVEVIEDLVPLFNVACSVRVPESVKSAKLVPGDVELELTRTGDGVAFTVPELLCHQMVELGY